MDDTKPAVSVIIPTYNYATFLPQAIDSVLHQTYRNYEVLIIDDGSTDSTAEVVQRYGAQVRYLPQANAGVSVARNRGISESVGKFIAFLDADDVWLPSKLEQQLSALASAPQSGLCYSAFTVANSNLKAPQVMRSTFSPSLKNLLFSGTSFPADC